MTNNKKIDKLYLAPYNKIDKLASPMAEAIWENRKKINEIISRLNK